MLLRSNLGKKNTIGGKITHKRAPKRFYCKPSYDYDLIVIGGGSGGLASSKDAAEFGKKVALFDYVTPSTQQTRWGIGGTCVNVGCIPKKLMHRAAILGEDIHESAAYGWSVDNVKHDWNQLVDNVQGHIRSLNFGYRVSLNQKKVKYYNALAKFKDANTIEYVDNKGKEHVITGENIIIAVGGRPTIPDIPGGKEYCITSDDLFSLDKAPGKTLVIGASYVALECAGFLTGLGYDTTVMVRSILLRGFDQQMAELIHDHMETKGTKFLRQTVPQKIEKMDDGKLKVYYKSDNGEIQTEFYDTVLCATGRQVLTEQINSKGIGLEMDKNGKLLVDKHDQTNIKNVYAIGDVVSGSLELTPIAIQAGKLLVERLYNNSNTLFSKHMVPTTVFTPIEYGAIGVSEEEAIKEHGEENIEVYHAFYTPLEYYLPHKPENQCYVKLVCLKTKKDLVLGFHIIGPNAGEVTQGFGTAMRLGATKKDFDDTVGIHPTVAEELTVLNITKRSGKDPKKSGC